MQIKETKTLINYRVEEYQEGRKENLLMVVEDDFSAYLFDCSIQRVQMNFRFLAQGNRSLRETFKTRCLILKNSYPFFVMLDETY